MSNILSEEEENIHRFTRDMKEFLRQGDFGSAIILIDDFKKYVLEMKKGKSARPCTEELF